MIGLGKFPLKYIVNIIKLFSKSLILRQSTFTYKGKLQCRISPASNNGIFWFCQRKKCQGIKIRSDIVSLLSLVFLWCTLVPMETVLGWLENDIHKCSVRSFLSNTLKFKPWFVIYSETSLTYSEGLGKDNLLKAETRCVTALCQVSASSPLFHAQENKTLRLPSLPAGDVAMHAAPRQQSRGHLKGSVPVLAG